MATGGSFYRKKSFVASFSRRRTGPAFNRRDDAFDAFGAAHFGPTGFMSHLRRETSRDFPGGYPYQEAGHDIVRLVGRELIV